MKHPDSINYAQFGSMREIAWFANHLALVTLFLGERVEGGNDAEVPHEPLPESPQLIIKDLDYQI